MVKEEEAREDDEDLKKALEDSELAYCLTFHSRWPHRSSRPSWSSQSHRHWRR